MSHPYMNISWEKAGEKKKKIITSESSPGRVRKNFPRTPNKSVTESQETELGYMTIADAFGQEEKILLRSFWCIPGLWAWQPTPVLLAEESHGQRSLADYSPRGGRVGHDWSNSMHAHMWAAGEKISWCVNQMDSQQWSWGLGKISELETEI